MGLPVTIYRYTDAGAPQVTNGTPSEWINVLKKVLVEGYGAKSSLGWSVEFESVTTFKIAFRNNVLDGGSGGYVQFSSNGGVNTINTTLLVKCAAAMTALDIFIKPLFQRGIFTTSASTHKGWEIIGTSRGFYLSIHCHLENQIAASSSARSSAVYFIGDIQSYIANDAGVFSFTSASNTAADSPTSNSLNESDSIYCQMNTADGENASYIYSCKKPHFGVNGYSAIDGNAEIRGIDHIMSPLQLIGIATALDSKGVAQMNSKSLPYCRGVLPGYHLSTFAGYRTENWPKEITQGGVKWVLMRGWLYTGQWVNAGTWYD